MGLGSRLVSSIKTKRLGEEFVRIHLGLPGPRHSDLPDKRCGLLQITRGDGQGAWCGSNRPSAHHCLRSAWVIPIYGI